MSGFAFSQVDPETSGRVTQLPTPIGDYLGAMFHQGEHDSAYHSISRMTEYSLEAGDDASPIIQPEDANKQYGIPGHLKFDRPTRETVAQLMRKRTQDQIDRDFIIQNGSSLLRTAPGLAASFIGGMSNPLDLGMLFIPIVGEEKLALQASVLGRSALRQSLARGALSVEGIARTGIPFPRLTSSMIQGSVGQAMWEIPNALATWQEGGEYTSKQFMTNVLAGGAFAGALHLGIHSAIRLYQTLRPETRELMLRKALSDTLLGNEIDVESLAKLDENALRGAMVGRHMSQLAEAFKSVDIKDVERVVREKYGEQIASTAVKDPITGKVYTGSNPKSPHYEILNKYAEEMGIHEGVEFPDEYRGFVTDTGRFIGRNESMVMSGLTEPMHSDHMDSGIGVNDEFTLEELVHEGYSNSEARQMISASRAERREISLREDPGFQRNVAEERNKQIQDALTKLKEKPVQEPIKPVLSKVEQDQHTHIAKDPAEVDKIQKDIEGLKESTPKPEVPQNQQGVFAQALAKVEKRIEELSKPEQYTRKSTGETGATTLLDLVSRPIARGALIVIREALRAGISISQAIDHAMEYIRMKRDQPKGMSRRSFLDRMIKAAAVSQLPIDITKLGNIPKGLDVNELAKSLFDSHEMAHAFDANFHPEASVKEIHENAIKALPELRKDPKFLKSVMEVVGQDILNLGLKISDIKDLKFEKFFKENPPKSSIKISHENEASHLRQQLDRLERNRNDPTFFEDDGPFNPPTREEIDAKIEKVKEQIKEVEQKVAELKKPESTESKDLDTQIREALFKEVGATDIEALRGKSWNFEGGGIKNDPETVSQLHLVRDVKPGSEGTWRIIRIENGEPVGHISLQDLDAKQLLETDKIPKSVMDEDYGNLIGDHQKLTPEETFLRSDSLNQKIESMNPRTEAIDAALECILKKIA